MSGDPKLDEAQQLIKAFAAQLLALNNGKPIPRQWKNALLKAIKPAPQRRGRKADYSTIAAVSKQLTRNRDRLAAPDRTIKDKRGDAKQVIADSLKISSRAVERVAKNRRELLDGRKQLPLDEKGRAMLDKEGRAIIEGTALAISDEWAAELPVEQTAENKAMRRKQRMMIDKIRAKSKPVK